MTYQIIYSSESAMPMQRDDLEEILAQARSSNAEKGITGALVYAQGAFLQILEGERAKVQDLMAKISRDLRHETLIVLQEAEIPSAVFGAWKMAYVSATPEQVAAWIGISPTTESAEGLADIGQDPDRTAQLLQNILSLLEPADMPAKAG